MCPRVHDSRERDENGSPHEKCPKVQLQSTKEAVVELSYGNNNDTHK